MASTASHGENLGLELRTFFDSQPAVEPIMASGSARPDPEKIQRLYDQASDIDKNTIRDFVSHLRYVSDDELMDKFRKIIAQLPAGPFDLLLPTDKGIFKSNHWFVHRLWPLIKDKIVNIITDYNFITDFNIIPENPLLYVDDVMMTGSQFTGFLYYYSRNFRTVTSIQNVFAVVPFIGDIALEEIKNVEFNNIKFNIYVAPLPLIEIIPKIEVAPTKLTRGSGEYVIPLYFDHNIADPVCTLCFLITSIVSQQPLREAIEIEGELFKISQKEHVEKEDPLGRKICMFEPVLELIEYIEYEKFQIFGCDKSLVITDHKKRENLTKSLIITINAEEEIINNIDDFDWDIEDIEKNFDLVLKYKDKIIEKDNYLYYIISKYYDNYPEFFTFDIIKNIKNELKHLLDIDKYFLKTIETREDILRVGIIPYYVMAYSPQDNLFLGGVWTFVNPNYPYIGIYGIRNTIMRYLTNSKNHRTKGIGELLISHIIKYAKINHLRYLIVIDPPVNIVPILKKLNFQQSTEDNFNSDIYEFYKPIAITKVYWYLPIPE